MPSTVGPYAARDTPETDSIPPMTDLWTERQRDIMRDVFRLARDHYTITGDDSYWEELRKHSDSIILSYDSDRFAVDMCLAVVMHFSDKWVKHRKQVELERAMQGADESQQTQQTERRDDESCKQLSMLS